MRVMLLTGDGIEHRYVARCLSADFPDIRILAEHPRTHGSNPVKRIRRWMAKGPGCVADKILRECFRRVIADGTRRTSDLMTILGADHDLEQPVPGTEFVANINHGRVRDVAREMRPDLALVYGTGLVRGSTLEVFDCPVLNLHTGLSPYYRGVACHYWPLIDGRPDRMGVTVHDCVKQLDAGDILATRTVPPRPGDTIHTVFARQVVAGASLYAEVAGHSLAGAHSRQVQHLEQGREYRGVELGFIAEWRARRALRRLKSASFDS